MNGILNLLKPAGMTSHDAVAVARKLFLKKKVGHTGTLDPMASGVLPLCIGYATKAVEYLEGDKKEYRCEVLLGFETDSCDIWGKPLLNRFNITPDHIKEEQIISALKQLEGKQEQYPPIYSAIKVNGKKLYEYARRGESVNIKPRLVTIYSLNPISIFHEKNRVIFDVKCSKGTYVRSICRDLGRLLGCGATLSMLVRSGSGKLGISTAVSFEDILNKLSAATGNSWDEILAKHKGLNGKGLEGQGIKVQRAEVQRTMVQGAGIKGSGVQGASLPAFMEEFLIPVDKMLEGFGSIRLSEVERLKFVNGGKVAVRNTDILLNNSRKIDEKYSDIFRVYDQNNIFIGTAIYDKENQIYKVDKVFVR